MVVGKPANLASAAKRREECSSGRKPWVAEANRHPSPAKGVQHRHVGSTPSSRRRIASDPLLSHNRFFRPFRAPPNLLRSFTQGLRPGLHSLRRFAAASLVAPITSGPLANSELKLETISACLSLFLSLARLPSSPAVHAASVRLRSACLCTRGRAFCSTTKRPKLRPNNWSRNSEQENCAAMACNLSGTGDGAGIGRGGGEALRTAGHPGGQSRSLASRGRAHRQRCRTRNGAAPWPSISTASSPWSSIPWRR